MTLLALEVSGQGQEGWRKLSRPPRLRRGLGSSSTAVAPRSAWGTGETGSSPAPQEWGEAEGPDGPQGFWSRLRGRDGAILKSILLQPSGLFPEERKVSSSVSLTVIQWVLNSSFLSHFFFFLITKSPRSLLQLASYTASQPYNTQHGK